MRKRIVRTKQLFQIGLKQQVIAYKEDASHPPSNKIGKGMKTKLILTALLFAPFMAFAEESMGDPNVYGECVAARDLFDKIILYGSSLVVALVAAFMLAKSFGPSTVLILNLR